MPVTLYKRQKQIVDFIAQFIQKNGYSPTLQQIADAINVSSLATVHEHLATLVNKKVIKKNCGSVRGIELINKSGSGKTNSLEMPVLGFIAAGMPIEPFTDPNATIKVSGSMVSGNKRSYVLQVKGESMIEDGILDRDYVVVEEQDYANNGDIVIAMLENGMATLKRYFKESTRIKLAPANSQMQPIYVNSVRIQGKVVGIVRNY